VKDTSTLTGPTVELLVGGTVVSQTVTPSSAAGSTAETIGAVVVAFFTVKSAGVSGTLDAYIGWLCSFRQGTSETSAVANQPVDTTIANVLEVRARMASAVASNSISARQGFYERVQ
jgi:hypothetical protein